MAGSGRAYYDSKQAADAEFAEIMAAADRASQAADRIAGVRAIRTIFAILDDREARRDKLPFDTQAAAVRQHRS